MALAAFVLTCLSRSRSRSRQHVAGPRAPVLPRPRTFPRSPLAQPGTAHAPTLRDPRRSCPTLDRTVTGELADLVEQCPQQRLDWHRLRPAQERQRVCADRAVHRLQRGDDIRPKERGFVVVPIECDPGGGASIDLGNRPPFSQQGRFARACRRRDEGQFARRRPVQTFDQSGALHQIQARSGNMELGLEQGAGF